MRELERIRRLRGLSQKNLADAAGTAEGTVAGIEAGRHTPRASTARKLATALGVEVADLYGEAIPKARPPKERIEDRLRPRVARLESLELSELSERRRELEARLSELKEVRPYGSGVKEEIPDVYFDVMDELLATTRVLERIAGRVEQ